MRIRKDFPLLKNFTIQVTGKRILMVLIVIRAMTAEDADTMHL